MSFNDSNRSKLEYDKLQKKAIRLDDESTSNVTYVGKADIGTATSAAKWQIFRIDETTGLVITWADSNANYDNVWDDRVSLTYG